LLAELEAADFIPQAHTFAAVSAGKQQIYTQPGEPESGPATRAGV